MAAEYSKEELQKLYDALPKDLQEAMFSDEVAKIIQMVCRENNIEGQNTEVAKCVGDVLLGLLPPSELENSLREELKLSNGTAKNVAKEIVASVFYPLKESLEALYKITIEKPPIEKKPTQKRAKDTYREPIE